MLSITINNKALDLPPNISVPFTLLSPYFDRDKIERSFTFPVTIPASPNNQALLSYPTRLDGQKKRKYQGVALRLGGVDFEKGVLVITNVRNREIEIAFQNENLDKTQQLQRRSLQEIEDTYTAVTSYTPKIYLKLEYVAGTDNGSYYYLQINEDLFTGLMIDRTGIVSSINTLFPGLCTLFRNEVGFIIIELDTAIKPDLQLTLRPEKPDSNTYKGFDLEIVDVAAEESYADTYETYLNGITQNPTTHTFPTIYAPEFYDGDVEDYKKYVNFYFTGLGYQTNRDFFFGSSWQYSIVPMFFLKSVVQQVFQLIEVNTIQGDFFEDPDVQKIIVYNNQSLDANISQLDFVVDPDNVPSAESFNPWNGWAQNYNMAGHVPEQSSFEFLQSIGSTFPLIYRFENNAVYINTVNALLSQAPIDLSKYVQQDFDIEYSTIEGYKLSYDRQGAEASETELLDVVSGDENEELFEQTSEFFSLYAKDLRVEETASTEKFWLVPEDTESGSSALADRDTQIPLKLLIYFGLQPDNNGNNYPFAHYKPINRAGTPLGDLSLEWNGENGLYKKYWSKYIALLSGDPIDMIFYLPLYVLLDLRRNVTAPIIIKHLNGQIKAVFQELKFNATIEQKSIIRVEAKIVRLS